MPTARLSKDLPPILTLAIAIWLTSALVTTGETRLEAQEIAKKKATVEKTEAVEAAKRSATAEKAMEVEATKREAKASAQATPSGDEPAAATPDGSEPKDEASPEEVSKELSKASPAEKKAAAITETKKEVAAAKGEATMVDESTPKNSLPTANAEPDEHEDCGLDFAQMKEEGRASGARGDLAVFSGFELKFKDEINPFSLMTTMVRAEEEFTLQVTKVKEADTITVTSEAGVLTKLGPRSWRWKAPVQPGPYCIKVSKVGTADMACLQAFVLVKYGGEDSIGGFPVGQYPDSTTKTKDPVKMRTEGFIEVTKENQDTWISPHFQLKQFLGKGYEEYPKYVIVRTRLLMKLEMLLEECKKAGIPAESLYVMSGFRTPAYNTKIGNKTTLSRHTFGDAADVYVDENRDGMIDDLNKDGKSDIEDARMLHELVAKASKEGWRKPLDGGLSLYPGTEGRSPFIHVDARGVDIHWDGL